MAEYKVDIAWKRETEDFSYKAYNRSHTWHFQGGTTIQASSAPEYLGSAQRVNPEEAMIAALSSCHMLTFLAIAAYKHLIVDNYEDNASGLVGKNSHGKMALTQVTLRPKVAFSSTSIPDSANLKEMHEKAHENCFIANSVLTKVIIEPISDEA